MNQAVRPKQKTSATAGETAIDPKLTDATVSYRASDWAAQLAQ
jgi:hypothetical protein